MSVAKIRLFFVTSKRLMENIGEMRKENRRLSDEESRLLKLYCFDDEARIT